MKKLAIAFCLMLTFGSPYLLAQDSEGCKDSPLISRFPGSEIRTCEDKEFNSVDMPLADGTKTVEGEYHNWDYAAREVTSNIQIYRNFQTALKNAGFTLDFVDPANHLTAHKDNAWITIEFPGEHYYQTIVLTKAMQQDVTADASTLADSINKTGRVAVYGINFYTGKDSENVLQEIRKLLTQNPAWKLRVEGHTDNTGTAAGNQALSEKRAQAVVTWLTTHGVAANRLSAAGYGQTKPVADNSPEDGRAKNRRVELAKI